LAPSTRPEAFVPEIVNSEKAALAADVALMNPRRVNFVMIGSRWCASSGVNVRAGYSTAGVGRHQIAVWWPVFGTGSWRKQDASPGNTSLPARHPGQHDRCVTMPSDHAGAARIKSSGFRRPFDVDF
jgi:hypothetical protein